MLNIIVNNYSQYQTKIVKSRQDKIVEQRFIQEKN